MASQEEKVEGQQTETNAADDVAKFSEAWDSFEKEATGQPAEAAGRQDGTDEDSSKGGDEAGQGEAQAGQPDAGTTPSADAGEASRVETSDDGKTSGSAASSRDEELRKAQNLARSNAGRLAQALRELDALRKQVADKTTGEGDGSSDQEREELLREFPEVAKPLLDRIDRLTGQVETLQGTATQRAEAEVQGALADEFTALTALHPDVQSIVADPAYAEWVKGQAPMIQRIVEENSKAVVSAADCAMVFDLFKARPRAKTPEELAAEETARKRADQLDAGRTATGKQPGIRSDAGGDQSYEAAWDQFDRLDKQKAASRR